MVNIDKIPQEIALVEVQVLALVITTIAMFLRDWSGENKI